MRLRMIAAAGLVTVGMLVPAACSSGGSSDAKYTVGFSLSLRVPEVEQEVAGFKSEFLKQTGLKPGDVKWVEKNADGDDAKCASIARELAGEKLDAVAVVGTPCIVAMAQATRSFPVIAMAMADPVSAGVADSVDKPGGNVTGTYQGADAGPFIDTISEIQPPIKRIATIYDQSSDAMLQWVDSLKKEAESHGIEVVARGVTTPDQVANAARSVASDVDAFAIGPDGVVSGVFPVLLAAAQQYHVPVFTSGAGSDYAKDKDGIVATMGLDFTAYGRTSGQIAARVVTEHASPATTPFENPNSVQWLVNKAAVADHHLELPSAMQSSASADN